MLASPLLMTAQPNPFSPKKSLSSDENPQYRPSKDLETFNSLLPPPIEFVEGSSSDALAVTEGKYEPINATPKRTTKVETAGGHDSKLSETPSIPSSPTKSSQTPTAKTRPLFSGDIDLSWPHDARLGSGLYNTGNTCFLNSSIQCLLHTPPLLHLLRKHDHNNCPSRNKFCMSCALRTVAIQSHSSRAPFSPNAITGRLQAIAKHMRRGRQEDSHEFLRYAIDGLQRSCLAGFPPKIDHKLAETTWVHKLFGGRLRSQVSCQSCGHNSDTFDSMLDLSLDIHHSQTLKDALRKFVAPDYLRGADKYKCEKCNKHVNATKRFTIHEAPVVLTVHLKRFSPLGSKISNLVTYDEQLSLDPYMSKGQYGPTYSLYGVICHAGGGPHSGHYYAFVKGKDNKWYEMNDESVSTASPPTRNKNSYILFYMKNKGQKLESAMQPNNQPANTPLSFTPTQVKKSNVASQMQKKKRPRDEEGGATSDPGAKVDRPFIGPVLPSQQESSEGSPSQAKKPKLSVEDPQANVIKRKINSAKAKASLPSLVGSYGSDEDEDVGEVADRPEETSSKLPNDQRTSSPPPSSPRPPVSASTTPRVSGPIPPSSFYGTPASSKRKSSFGGIGPANGKLNKHNGFNPYTFGKKGKKRFRAL
ncbi:hypothetical protein GYMLUDRAFT_36569 [Collybiopsis luxurians FD-317 M1]|nr:hypothetical protein GYMLUDRAFT_36569 [Collybiopsis luxurians FD-317 M1]